MSVSLVRFTLSPPIPLWLYTAIPVYPTIFYFWHLGVRAPECQKLKCNGLDQYGAEPFEQQQFGTAGVEGAKHALLS